MGMDGTVDRDQRIQCLPCVTGLIVGMIVRFRGKSGSSCRVVQRGRLGGYEWGGGRCELRLAQMTHCFVIARSMAVQNAAQPHLPVQHGDVGQPQQSPIQVPLRDRFNVRSPDTWASWVRRFNMTQADSTVPTTPTTPPLTIADNGPTPDVTPATATPNPD